MTCVLGDPSREPRLQRAMPADAVPGSKDSAVAARLVGIARWQHGQRGVIPRDAAEQT